MAPSAWSELSKSGRTTVIQVWSLTKRNRLRVAPMVRCQSGRTPPAGLSTGTTGGEFNGRSSAF
jgi:hypothetical protein